MKIGVCIKQVPASDAPLHFDPDANWIQESGTSYEMNESDLFALEEALRLRDELGGEVVIISLGPDRVQQVIRDGLGRGADRGIHITHDTPHTLEPLQIATCIAEVIREEAFDLLLSGVQSTDLGYGQTGIVLAELLDQPHASLVVEIVSQEEGLKVRRELEGGAYQWSLLPLPCTLSIQSGINKPRYAGMKGIMAAKKKEIRSVPAPALCEATTRIQAIFIPQKSGQAEFIEGSPQEICVALADRLVQAMGVR